MLQPHKSAQKIATFDSNAFTLAMLGVVLVLLTISLVVAPTHQGRGPDLPRVNHPVAMHRADRADALIVMVSRDGQFYLGGSPMDKTRAIHDLKVRLSLGAEPKIYIAADARARYSTVSKVLDVAAAAG